METVQIQLPLPLVQKLQRETSSIEAIGQVIAEAIQMWLEKRLEEKANGERVSQILRQAGLIMAPERQRALAESIMSKLTLQETPTLAQVEAALSKLKVPLSDEIIAMRGER
jgi:hypothetical protein